MKTPLTLFIAGCAWALSACGTAPSVSAPGLIGPIEPPAGTLPTPEEVVARMGRSLESTPVLHLTIRDRHHGIDYECQGWMMGTKVLGETRRNGKLVFASYSDGQRVQEFLPKHKFANGMEAENVLLEHDPVPGDWFCLPEIDFICGPGSIATNAYIGPRQPTIPNAYLVNLQAPTVMEEATLEGRVCYWFHFVDMAGPDTKITWSFHVDKATCEPVRLSRLIETNGKATKDDVYEYAFEHLPNDKGIHWGLDPAQLRK